MAITNLYPSLPGHLVEFKDGGLQLRNSNITGSSKSLLILGTAIDGPVGEPVAIDAENIEKLYGKEINTKGVPNGSTLVKYAKQAYSAGFDDIRCMRVTGSHAEAKVEKSVKTTTTLVAETLQMTARGNDKKTIQLTFPTIPSGSVGAIKKESIAITHPSVGNAISNVFNLPNSIVINADQVPARGDITVSYKTQIIDSSNASSMTGLASSNDKLDTNGDNIIDVTIKAEALANVYEYNMDGLEVGVATKDNHEVPVTSNLHEVSSNAGNVYFSLKLKDIANEVKAISSAKLLANGDLVITFIETGSQGTPTFEIGDSFDIDYVSFTSTDGQVVAKQEELYTPQKLKVNVSKPPANEEDVFLYDSSGKNIITKMSSSDNVISFDESTLTFTINLSKVPPTTPLGYITTGATLKLVYLYEIAETAEENITFVSLYGGEEYNQASVTVDLIMSETGEEGRLFTLIKPNSKKYSANEEPITFKSFEYPTFGMLRDALDSHKLNNVFKASTDFEDSTTGDIPLNETNSLTIMFAGGTDGLNPTNDEMFVALSGLRDEDGYLAERGAYQVLENYNVDNVYVAGIYADSKVSPAISKKGFHEELATLCAVLTYRTKMVHGYMDVKPNTNTTLVGIQNHVEKLLSYDNVVYMRDNNGDIVYNEDNKPLDIGWYTSVVVGPDVLCTSPTLGTYYGSPAIAYAALNARLTAQSAPTNKSLPGCIGMRYKLSNKQLNDLTEKRYVTFKYKHEGLDRSGIPYVVDGCTAGAPGSDYARLTTVKVVTRVVDEIRDVADPFIGEPNSVEQRNALAALVSKRLDALKEQGVIQFFEFEISATVEQVLLGEASIALVLVAPQELRKITTVVSLRAAA